MKTPACSCRWPSWCSGAERGKLRCRGNASVAGGKRDGGAARGRLRWHCLLQLLRVIRPAHGGLWPQGKQISRALGRQQPDLTRRWCGVACLTAPSKPMRLGLWLGANRSDTEMSRGFVTTPRAQRHGFKCRIACNTTRDAASPAPQRPPGTHLARPKPASAVASTIPPRPLRQRPGLAAINDKS